MNSVTGVPALFSHCQKVCDAMYAESTKRETWGVEQTVWQGSGTKLLATLGLTSPYYSSVMRELQRMGCIEQYRRGGGGAGTIWILHKKPTEQMWLDTSRDRTTNTTRSSTAQLKRMNLDNSARITDLERRILQLEEIVFKEGKVIDDKQV